MKFKAYFQDELNYLHDAGNEYSKQNPRLAKYLSDSSSDPDIQQLMEGFAFLSGRLRQTLDDELSPLTQSVLRILWSGFLAPIPPISMIKFTPDDRAITKNHHIRAGMGVCTGRLKDNVYFFETTSHCDIYPLEVHSSRLERSQDRSALFIRFSTLSGLPLSETGLNNLRLWLIGSHLTANTMFLWLNEYLQYISLSGHGKPSQKIPPGYLKPAGFEPTEALLPGQKNAFDKYRILQEYFAFPQKFRCIDLSGLEPYFINCHAQEFTLEFHFNRPVPSEVMSSENIYQLYCTPAVNLTRKSSKAFSIDTMQSLYPLEIEANTEEHSEIFSVEAIQSWEDNSSVRSDLKPYHALVHQIEPLSDRRQIYYREHMVSRQIHAGFDHAIEFLYHNGFPAYPRSRNLSAKLLCFNPDAHYHVDNGDISIPTQDSPSFAHFNNFTVPTKTLYPSFDDGIHWKLISNLSQNIMHITDAASLNKILEIFDYPARNDRIAEHQSSERLKGIISLETTPIDRLFQGQPRRGIQSVLKVKGSAFSNLGEMYLFSTILSEFFALYATQNSFHQLKVTDIETDETFVWAPQQGCQPLL